MVDGVRAWMAQGRAGLPRNVLELRVRWLLLVAVIVANVAGGLVVVVFVTFVIPDPPDVHDPGHVRLVNLIAFSTYPLFAGPLAVAWGSRLFRPIRRLVREGGAPDEEQQIAVLHGPLRLVMVEAILWGAGTVGWTALNATHSGLLALKMGMTCLLGAVTTCAIVYLVAERLLRPAAVLALATGLPPGGRLFGVTTRSMLFWALGTAVPVLGMVVMSIAALSRPGFSVRTLSTNIIALGVMALLVGAQVTYVAARAVGDPIRSVRKGLSHVERGDLDTEVAVYDASELGMLQTGFNHMVAGLRAHERLQDLFGRHVGRDVADLALHTDVELGGEVREVAVLFVDLAGSTRLAETRPPQEVVALLNAFFGVVVDVVTRHDGWINKFEGDAALAIFGAPMEIDDAGGCALAAARELAGSLARDVPQIHAGIGVSAGPVVAGHIGALQRFEYTVIGSPVNEAARLSDLAKAAPGGALALAAVVEAAPAAEAAHWAVGEMVTLRGSGRPTRLAMPAPVGGSVPAGAGPTAAGRRRLTGRRSVTQPATRTEDEAPPVGWARRRARGARRLTMLPISLIRELGTAYYWTEEAAAAAEVRPWSAGQVPGRGRPAGHGQPGDGEPSGAVRAGGDDQDAPERGAGESGSDGPASGGAN